MQKCRITADFRRVGLCTRRPRIFPSPWQTQSVDARSLIAVRRDGGKHSPHDLEELARGAASGTIPDYQLAAWLMAAYLKPLSLDETAWLTQAMAASGSQVDRAGLPKPWVDKHSTGGVGDKTSIVLLPMLAACGITTVKMSGPGLGITGGTVDKLSAIPGFRTSLSPEEMREQAEQVGIAWSGQSPDLAPADKALYALRDATATVESIPLIASSILCKKVASGAEVVVMDVKCGSGAFMKDLPQARALAQALEEVGARCGLTVRSVVTDMEQPLGRAAGNALEVVEAIEVLNGARGSVRDLCVHLCALTLAAAQDLSWPSALERSHGVLDSGEAAEKARLWINAQGGDLAAIPCARVVREVAALRAGWVARVDAAAVGSCVVELGGGRRKKGDSIDVTLGVETLKRVGDEVSSGDVLFRVHAASEESAEAAIHALGSAASVSESPVAGRPLIL